MRDHSTKQRRPFIRFFALGQDLSHEPPDAPLPDEVVAGQATAADHRRHGWRIVYFKMFNRPAGSCRAVFLSVLLVRENLFGGFPERAIELLSCRNP
jgi:hypothetical protein